MNIITSLFGNLLQWVLGKLALIGVGYGKAISDGRKKSINAAETANKKREDVKRAIGS